MKVLYLCRHNRCRSILSEAITNHMAGGRIIARSAGIYPQADIHPLVPHYLQQSGILFDDLHSKSLTEIADFDPNIVITLCADTHEFSKALPDDQLTLHWGLNNPAAASTSDIECDHAFQRAIAIIQNRVEMILNLPIETIAQEETLDELSYLSKVVQ